MYLTSCVGKTREDLFYCVYPIVALADETRYRNSEINTQS